MLQFYLNLNIQVILSVLYEIDFCLIIHSKNSLSIKFDLSGPSGLSSVKSNLLLYQLDVTDLVGKVCSVSYRVI
jgi:hypothetical protein